METLYYNGKQYSGDAVYINGYNGYTSTKEDATLCVIINNSAFTNGKPNTLTTKDGAVIHNTNLRGVTIKI